MPSLLGWTPSLLGARIESTRIEKAPGKCILSFLYTRMRPSTGRFPVLRFFFCSGDTDWHKHHPVI